jgi:hypothetical protein
VPNEGATSLSDPPAGRYIGALERTIVFILVVLQQYTALAFVLTAKSIARFNKIAEDPVFAEKYLLGTLASILLAIVAGILYAYC